ncbi:hypothetical protein ILUMI_17399, partial [Ignelater luminosus]
MSLEQLTRKRDAINAKITLFKKYLDVVATKAFLSELDLVELHQRLDKAELLYNEFDEVHGSIEEKIEESKSSEQIEERETFETAFYSQISLAKIVIIQNSSKQ